MTFAVYDAWGGSPQAMLVPHFLIFFDAIIRILAAPIVRADKGVFASDHPKTRVVARVAAMRTCIRDLRLHKTGRQTMPKGTVKWFNATKGYGFIQPSTGEKDVFVHISAVERAGLSSLNEGQTVEYELVSNRGKTSAENLKVS
jgi:cold shock protein